MFKKNKKLKISLIFSAVLFLVIFSSFAIFGLKKAEATWIIPWPQYNPTRDFGWNACGSWTGLTGNANLSPNNYVYDGSSQIQAPVEVQAASSGRNVNIKISWLIEKDMGGGSWQQVGNEETILDLSPAAILEWYKPIATRAVPNPESVSSNFRAAFRISSSAVDYSGNISCAETSPLIYRDFTVTASPKLLTLSKNGTGSGIVTSSPSGISCGANCSYSFPFYTDVVLTASQNSDSTFAGWSGEGCSGTGTCTVKMDRARNVTATFTKSIIADLSVEKNGNGSGVVYGSNISNGINCGPDCFEKYSEYKNIFLLAKPDAGSTFVGWNGCDSVSDEIAGSGDGRICSIYVSSSKKIVATFSEDINLNLQTAGNGSGNAISNPSGINCSRASNSQSGDCSEIYQYNTFVTIQASPDPGVTVSWWGCASVNGNFCTVNMDLDRTVILTFTLGANTLTVTKPGTGTGTVTSNPAGIVCGGTCVASYASNSNVVLTATPDVGSTFLGWSGTGINCPGTGTCTVTMDASKTVTATFNANVAVNYSLNLAKAGSGTITGSCTPAPTCTQSYVSGTLVTLTATPSAGYNFTGWSGNCSGTGNCVLTMNSGKTVTGNFACVPDLSTFTCVAGSCNNCGGTASPTCLNSCGSAVAVSNCSNCNVTNCSPCPDVGNNWKEIAP